MNHLGNLFSNRGDFEKARGFFDESLNLACESNDKYAIGHAYHGLGRLAHLRGGYEEAQEYYNKSISVLQEIKGYVVITWSLIALADLACLNGQLCRAVTLLGASEKLQEISSTALLLIRREEFERVIANTRAQLDEVKFTEAWNSRPRDVGRSDISVFAQ